MTSLPVRTRNPFVLPALALAVGLVSHAAGLRAIAPAQSARAPVPTPAFTVDPSWPQPLPDGWSVGPVSGITVDAQDRITIIHRAEAVRNAGGTPAPPVVEFDPAGRVVRAWGGPGRGFDWPEQVHGITVDHMDRVWISGNGGSDSHILAFSRDGRFLRQIGQPGRKGGSNDTANLGRATQMRVDPATGDLYVSDGEMNQNHRVIVFDAETGRYKRHWGAYGTRPDDAAVLPKFDPFGPPPRQFGSAVHCVRLSRDGLVYVCDRSNNRFQVFRGDGTFVREEFVARETGGAGSVWDLDFSPDQRFLYVADGSNQKVWIVDRGSHAMLGSFGGPGKAAGQFATSLHDIAVDSKGNLYTGEAASGGRVQKFVAK